MTSTTTVFQATGECRLELDQIVAALSSRFVVATGPRQIVRRVRLDTFDRRLRAAGLTLEHLTLRSGERLMLHGPDEPPYVAVRVDGLGWPAFADALPAGPIRERVAPLTGIRALMVTSDQKRRVQRLGLHNTDQKTVVRVELDEPASRAGGPAGVNATARLSVLALRGYGDEAARASRLLLALGLRPVEPGDDGDTFAGCVDRDSPATDLLASALGGFLAVMRVNIPGLLDDVDTEFLHDFRVAVRRSRSTLKLGRPCLPEVMNSRWEAEFKRLGDLTTPVRDLDVYQLGIPTMQAWLVASDPADLEPLAAHLRRRRAVERRLLVRRLRSASFGRLLGAWEDELAALAQATDHACLEPKPGPKPKPGANPGPDPGAGPGAGPGYDNDVISAGRLADRSISRAYRRVARDGAAISGDSPASDLHSLRKRCKELRYAIEVFAPVAKVSSKRAVLDLKELQDVLGRFQDSEVQRQALRGFAEKMMNDGTPTGALLAMGELIGHLDAEQDRARQAFHAAFAHFARPSNQRMMEQFGGRG